MTSGAPRFQPRVRILYEDSRAATNGFGLHDFVLANVHDVIRERGLEVEPHRLRKLVEAIPKKSDTKVLSALERDAEGFITATPCSSRGSMTTRSIGHSVSCRVSRRPR